MNWYSNGYFRNHMCCFKAWAHAKLSDKIEYQQQVAICLCSVMIWQAPMKMVFKLQHTRITCEKEVSWMTAIWTAWFLLCSSSQRPYCCEEHVAEESGLRRPAPSERRTGWQGCPSTEMKGHCLVIKLCSSVSVTPRQLPTALPTTCCLLSTNCL